MPDFDRMAADVVAAARGFVDRALVGIGKRVDELEQRIAEVPAGKDGAPGRDGIDGKDGIAGADGINGRDGRDGLPGITGEKGVDGSNGKDGADGKDGLGFDDLSVEYDGERTFALKFQRDAEVKEFKFTLPIVLERGVYKEGTEYARGDGVTWGGSYWIAQKHTISKPDSGDGGWRLAIKRGRDGADGKPGVKGIDGKGGK